MSAERRARITANLKNLRVLAKMKHLRKVGSLGTKENPVGGKAK